MSKLRITPPITVRVPPTQLNPASEDDKDGLAHKELRSKTGGPLAAEGGQPEQALGVLSARAAAASSTE